MPMTPFRQRMAWYEDGYGKVVALFVVADTYAGLFDLSTAIDVDLFAVSNTKHDLDTDVGVQVEDQIEFKMDVQIAETQDDLVCVDFVLDAQSSDVDQTKRRFVAMFCQPADEDAPVPAELEFVGVVSAKMTAEDLQWFGSQWGSAPSPIRRWSCTAAPFFSDSFDKIELHDLIHGNTPNNIPGITSTWETAHVADRLGYFKETSPSRETKWRALVSLVDVLRVLADNLEDALANNNYGAFTITFLDSPLGVNFVPAHMSYVEYPGGIRGRYVFAMAPNPQSVVPTPGRIFVSATDDSVELNLASATTELQPFISYALLKPDFIQHPTGAEAKSFTFESFKTFTGLLYALAQNFGCYLEFRVTDGNTVNIRFRSRKDVIRDPVFIRDVELAALDVYPVTQSKDRTKYYAQPFGLVRSEGLASYEWSTGSGLYEMTAYERKQNTDGERLPLSISVALRTIRGFARDGNADWFDAQLPHNAAFVNSGVLGTHESNNATSITTGIYMMTHGGHANAEYGLTSGDAIIEPVGSIVAEIDGAVVEYRSLAAYVNRVFDRDEGFYDADYELTIPFICSFRRSADGTHADDDGGRGRWQNIEVGSQHVVDGITWIVVGLERQWEEKKTKLRIHRASRYAFESSNPAAAYEPDQPAAIAYSPAANDAKEFREAGEDVEQGDALALLADEKVYRAIAQNPHYGRVIGVATHDAVSGQLVGIADGLVSNSGYVFTPGAPVFLRTSTLGTPNIQSGPLLVRSSTEDMFCNLGVALSATSFKYQPGIQYIFHPPIV